MSLFSIGNKTVFITINKFILLEFYLLGNQVCDFKIAFFVLLHNLK